MVHWLDQFLITEIQPFLTRLLSLGGASGRVVTFGFLTLLTLAGAFVAESFIRERLFGRRGKGLKHAAADMVKLLMQGQAVPAKAEKGLFFWTPVCAFVLGLFFFLVQPMLPEKATPRLNAGLLYLVFIAGLSGYTFFLGGLAGGSRFAFLGALRNLAQTLSCQLVMMLTAAVVLMTAGSANLTDVVAAQKGVWYVFPHFPMFVLFLLSCSVMSASAPFGASKDGRLLAGGVYAEYSGGAYLFFICADRILLLFSALMSALMFFGGWNPLPFFPETPSFWYLFVKTAFLFCLLVLIRSALPVFKTRDTVEMFYKLFLPFSFIWSVLTAAAVSVFQKGGMP